MTDNERLSCEIGTRLTTAIEDDTEPEIVRYSKDSKYN